MTAFRALIQRDATLALRDGGSIGTALGFYALVVTLTPLSLGPDIAALARIAPGILWMGLLLSVLLTLPRMFEADHEDGTLEMTALAPLPLEATALAKIVAHWLTSALPLIVVAPVLALLLNFDIAAYGWLVLTMLLGSPALSAVGAIPAALTLKSRKGAVLISVLVLPLYIPTLIFGISALSAVLTQAPGGPSASLLLLASTSLATLVLAPFATAAALRVQMT
jgi:heme exporter protein B